MDSLLANYGSSEDEEENQQPIPFVTPNTTSSSSSTSSSGSSSLFSSLPQPKSSSSSSSSLFQSLPKPKLTPVSAIDDDLPAPPSSSNSGGTASLFSSIPKPKSQIQQHQPKKLVQFRPPLIPIPKDDDDDDDAEDEEEQELNRRRKLESSTPGSSVKSFLSSIPAPRNSSTLGVQSTSGSARRSIIETEAPEPEPAPASHSAGYEGNVPVDQNSGDYVNYENYGGYQYGTDHNAESGYFVEGGASYSDYGSGYDSSEGFQPEATAASTAGYASGVVAYANYASYGGDYGQYANTWGDGSSAAAGETSGVGDSAIMFPKKRGRHEIPSEIIEVKQDELIKNRPREDQVKLTGVAFGPSYQPVSAKGKPSKLHKRKHQIGSLYFDMKQNEMKLAERRAKGMLTKAETQAKYGW